MEYLDEIEALSAARKIVDTAGTRNTDQPMPIREMRWHILKHIDNRVAELLKTAANHE